VKQSAISWCDYSGGGLNFVTGCTPVSEGCKNCYAKAIYDRFVRDFSKVIYHPDKLDRLRRKRFPKHSPKRGKPHKPMCFIVDMGDLFHGDVPAGFILDALEMMVNRKDITWQILTKRVSKMQAIVLRFCDSDWYGGEALPENVWLGVSIENQQRADERIPILLDTPAQVRFVSLEPMLGPIDMREYLWEPRGVEHVMYMTHDMALDAENPALEGEPFAGPIETVWEPSDAIQWIIVGAESGPHRRPFDPAWAKDIYDQCGEARVSFFGKQDSGLYPGKPLLIKGKEVKEWPL